MKDFIGLNEAMGWELYRWKKRYIGLIIFKLRFMKGQLK